MKIGQDIQPWREVGIGLAQLRNPLQHPLVAGRRRLAARRMPAHDVVEQRAAGRLTGLRRPQAGQRGAEKRPPAAGNAAAGGRAP